MLIVDCSQQQLAAASDGLGGGDVGGDLPRN